MKIICSGLLILIATSSASAIADDVSKNPFLKPSARVVEKKDACDISMIQKLVDEKVASMTPNSVDAKTVITDDMTNQEKILATGAKLTGSINGIDVYFDPAKGVFLYDDTTKEKAKKKG